MADELAFLEQWFLDQCDGDYEHDRGIHIETLDNPGWWISINLLGTDLEAREAGWTIVTEAGDRWARYRVAAGVFEAACGPRDLATGLAAFRLFVQEDEPPR